MIVRLESSWLTFAPGGEDDIIDPHTTTPHTEVQVLAEQAQQRAVNRVSIVHICTLEHTQHIYIRTYVPVD